MIQKICFIIVLCFCTVSSGTSVVRLTLPDIADHSGQILKGEITAIDSYWTEEFGPRTIETKVTLEHVSYFKGQRSRSTNFEFTVPGGTVGEMTMRIAGAPEFKLGEEWILFLLPEWKSFPTVGLYQGAYQLVEGIVKDGNGVPVADIDQEGFVISAIGSAKLQGRARGATVKKQNEVRKMSQQPFLQRIAFIAGNSKKIPLQHDSGKRVRADYTSVPLKEKQ
ncbi:MAG: hypothetical protein ISR75_06895 [Phycisphaerales bacterium]|nr:hypothetical protein [Planctomycetota bacterium]MBL6998146.1 hypothetical protein [Phycisphaerales bacterium]